MARRLDVQCAYPVMNAILAAFFPIPVSGKTEDICRRLYEKVGPPSPRVTQHKATVALDLLERVFAIQ